MVLRLPTPSLTRLAIALRYWLNKLRGYLRPDPATPPIDRALFRAVSCDVIVACDERNIIFLPEALRSIYNQTNAKPTVHVCFDQVTSDTQGIQRDFPGARFYESVASCGPFRIVNELMSYCEHEFVAIQDADDMSMPTRLVCSINELISSGKDFFGGHMEQFSDYRESSDATHQRCLKNPWHRSGTRWPLCPGGALINGTLVFRRSSFVAIGGYGDLKCSGDVDLCNRLYCGDYPTLVSPRIVGLRRLHQKSLTHAEFAPGSQDRKAADKSVMDRLVSMKQGKALPQSLGALATHQADPQICPIR